MARGAREKVKKDENNRWEKLKDIWGIIERLRGDSGCPWDRKQTPETIQTYLVEEAHEGAAAVRAGKAREVAEELGDILFMVFFLAYLYEERGDFALEEVCDRISAKMVRRHPHVFGKTSVSSAEEVKDNWEKIKAEEKSESGRAAEPVPETLPALIRAYRIVSRLAQKENGAWNDMGERALDFSRKSSQLVDALGSGEPLSAESIGDLFLDLVNLARIAGYRAEDCLHRKLREI
jgi:MazG family protein